MKSIKKIVASASLALSLLFSVNASAVIITQDIIVDGIVFGDVSYEISSAALNSGDIFDSFFDGQPTLAGVSFFGFGTSAVFGFEAVFDTFDISAGLEFLAFDVVDDDLVNPFTYQFIIDTFAGFGFLDVFDADDNFVFFSADVALGDVQVNSPSIVIMLVMMLSGLFAVSRKRQILSK